MARKERNIIRIQKSTGQVSVLKQADRSTIPSAPKSFTFDYAYDETSDQHQIYNQCAQPIIQNFTKGYNSTIFCYGQTGTGKTYTMNGEYTSGSSSGGIMPTTFQEVFGQLESMNAQYLVHVSYMEIYKEEIRDLLVDKPDAPLTVA